MKNWLKKKAKFFIGLLLLKKFKSLSLKKITESDCIFFLPFYHTGGAERVHLNILQALVEKKCTVIFTQNSSTNNFLAEFKKVSTIFELNPILNKKSTYINNKLIHFLANTINSSNSTTHVFGCNNNYYYKILPLICSSKKKIDLIHAIIKGSHSSQILANTASLIDVRVCINENAKKDLISIYKENMIKDLYKKKIKIIENGVNITNVENENFSEKELKFGFIGRWSDEKRPEIFLEVAKHIKSRYPDVYFVMAGTGMKSNIDKISNAGVVFLGEITNKNELNSLYNSLTGVIISSIYEGFPMVFMESMTQGVIPISTNVGGISQHITHLKNGLLMINTIKHSLIEEFINNIEDLIQDEDLRKKLSESTKEYAITNFNIDKFNLSYQSLFS